MVALRGVGAMAARLAPLLGVAGAGLVAPRGAVTTAGPRAGLRAALAAPLAVGAGASVGLLAGLRGVGALAGLLAGPLGAGASVAPRVAAALVGLQAALVARQVGLRAVLVARQAVGLVAPTPMCRKCPVSR